MSAAAFNCWRASCQRTIAERLPLIAFTVYCTLTAMKTKSKASSSQRCRMRNTTRGREVTGIYGASLHRAMVLLLAFRARVIQGGRETQVRDSRRATLAARPGRRQAESQALSTPSGFADNDGSPWRVRSGGVFPFTYAWHAGRRRRNNGKRLFDRLPLAAGTAGRNTMVARKRMRHSSDPWYVRLPDGRVLRAASTAAVRHHVNAGRVPVDSLVRRSSDEEWVALEWTQEFADLITAPASEPETSTRARSRPENEWALPEPAGIASRLDPMRLRTVGVRGMTEELLAALDI